MTKEEIFAQPLSALTLTPQALKGLLRSYMEFKEIERPDSSHRSGWKAYRDHLAQNVTIGEIVACFDVCDEEYRRRHLYNPDYRLRRQFTAELAKYGLTRLDWIKLPQATMTLEIILSLSKEEWLDKPVMLLGTIPERFIEGISFNPECCDGNVYMTIRELLQGPAKGSNYFYWRVSDLRVARTRNLLRQIGFTYEDGWFMQFGSERTLLMAWSEKHSISLREAELVYHIARNEGWVSQPID